MSSPDLEPVPAKPKRRRRRAAWVFWPLGLLGALFSFLLLGIAFLPAFYSPDRLRILAMEQGSAQLHTQVEIARLDYDLLSGFQLEGLRVAAPAPFTGDLLRIARLGIGWNLLGLPDRKFELRTLSIIRPQIVLETRDGRTSLDALLQNLAGQKSSTPADPKPPSPPGPLVPISVSLRDVAIEDLSLELRGEGPNVKVTGLGLEVEGDIDPRRVGARVRITTSREASLLVVVPAEAGTSPTKLDGAPVLSITASVAADASAGVTIERIGVDFLAGFDRLTVAGPVSAPKTDVRVRFVLDGDVSGDRLSIRPLELQLNRDRLLSASLAVDGLSALVAEALKTKPDSAAAMLGTRAKGPGSIRFELQRLSVPIAAVWPFASPFLSGATAGGFVDGRALIEGKLGELTRRAPRAVEVGLSVRDLTFAWPERGLDLGPTEFGLEATRTATAFVAKMDVDVPALQVPGARVEGLSTHLRGSVAALDPQHLGATEVSLGTTLERVQAGNLEVKRLRVGTHVNGSDLLDPNRPASSPVLVRGQVAVGNLASRTGTVTATVDDVALSLWAELERLMVAPGVSSPIRARVDVSVARVAQGAHRVSGLATHLGVSLPDPRILTPIDVDLLVAAHVDRVSTTGAELRGLQWAMSSRLERQPVDCPGCPTWSWYPAKAGFGLALVAPDIRVDHPATGVFSTSAYVQATAAGSEGLRYLDLQNLTFDLGNVVRASASASVRATDKNKDPLQGPQLGRVHLEILPIGLDRLLAFLPPAVLARLPGAHGRGLIALTVDLDGDLKRAGELARVTPNPPVRVDALLTLADLSLDLPPQGIAARALTGTVALTVAKGHTGASGHVTLEELQAPGASVRGLDVRLDTGLTGDEVRADASLTLRELGGASVSGVRGTRADITFRYPKFGEPTLERLAVSSPDSGFNVRAEGRLRRGHLGVLRPEAVLSTRLNFDKLKHVVAGLDALSGELGLSVDVASPVESAIDIKGAIDMHRLGYAQGDMNVSGVEGRLPFEQRIVLPRGRRGPTEPQGPGALGDDLERRLAELTDALTGGAQVYVDPVDAFATGQRSADYEALRPYDGKAAPRLSIHEIRVGRDTLKAISMDPSYRSGVIRLDRFAMQIWDGDIFGYMAAQLTEKGKIRFGIRSSVTDLNFDVPYAASFGVPKSDDDEVYRVSGILDLTLDEVEKQLGGNFELTKMSPQMVIRMLKVLDPEGANPSIQRSVGPLEAVLEVGALDILGERLSGVTVTIRQNLLSMSLHWDKHLIGLGWGVVPQVWLPALRVLQAVVGAGAKLFDKKFPLGIADFVPDVRRLPVSQVYPLWETLEQKLSEKRAGLVGRLTSGLERTEGEQAPPTSARAMP